MELRNLTAEYNIARHIYRVRLIERRSLTDFYTLSSSAIGLKQ